MNSKIRTAGVVIVCIMIPLISSTFYADVGSANSIWHDNFEDQNLEDWTVTRGVFSAENKTLWAYGTEAATSNRAYHECNVSVGTWKFDILLRQQWLWRYHPPAVRFMVDSMDDIVWQGYVLDFYTLHRSTGSILAVYLRVNADTWDYLSHYEYNIPAHGWQSIGIQRTSSGRLSIFLNESLIIDVVDNSLDNARYFVFDAEDCVQTVYDPLTHTDAFVAVRESPMLDNIVVAEIPELVDSNFTPVLFATSAIIAVVALVIIGKEEIKKHRS